LRLNARQRRKSRQRSHALPCGSNLHTSAFCASATNCSKPNGQASDIAWSRLVPPFRVVLLAVENSSPFLSSGGGRQFPSTARRERSCLCCLRASLGRSAAAAAPQARSSWLSATPSLSSRTKRRYNKSHHITSLAHCCYAYYAYYLLVLWPFSCPPPARLFISTSLLCMYACEFVLC
jgi:hypothetical protein